MQSEPTAQSDWLLEFPLSVSPGNSVIEEFREMIRKQIIRYENLFDAASDSSHKYTITVTSESRIWIIQ